MTGKVSLEEFNRAMDRLKNIGQEVADLQRIIDAYRSQGTENMWESRPLTQEELYKQKVNWRQK